MKKILLLLGCLLSLNACATATLPSGPTLNNLTQHSNALSVAVDVVDERESTKVGTIGALTVHVKKNIEDLVAGHLLTALNADKKINVVRSYSEELGGNAGNTGIIVSKIKTLNMNSADAILDPVQVDLSLEILVKNAKGEKTLHTFAMGRYSKRIGITIVDRSTGQLVDSVVKDAVFNLMQDAKFGKALESI